MSRKIMIQSRPYEVQLDRVKRWKSYIEKEIEKIRDGKYQGDIRILLDTIFISNKYKY